MSWAKVKKINSDMTTPLDKLIIGEKVLIPSDAALFVPEQKYENGKISDAYFCPQIRGVVNIKTVPSSTDTQTSRYGIRMLDENQNVLFYERVEVGIGGQNTPIYYEFAVEKGKKYRVEIYDISSGSNAGTVSICGQVTDFNYFDIEMIERA